MLLNSRVIITANELKAINPQAIRAIMVYKQGGNTPAKWQALVANGLLDIAVGKKQLPASQTLAGIRRALKLGRAVRFEVNGLSLQYSSLRVANAAIAELREQPAGNTTLVDIRLRQYVPLPANYPPGTVLIRGLVNAPY